MDPNSNKKPGNQPGGDGRSPFRKFLPIIVLALMLTLLFNSLFNTISSARMKEITYTEFLTMADEHKVAEVEFTSDRILITTREEAEKPEGKRITYYTGRVKNLELNELVTQLRADGVTVSEEVVEQMSPIISFLVSWVLPIAIMYGLLTLLTRSMSKHMGGIGGFGQSKAKVYMEKQTGVTFADVAGQDEAKESLVEIIDFLHYPQKYTAIGAKLPKGALLVGSPGTGKTLLAKAVAGEAGVPFFSISGSDFVEMFVGARSVPAGGQGGALHHFH